MKTIVLTNQKGGCSKTTTSHALAFGLHATGKKVLLVDLDAQCNLCDACNVDAELQETTLYDVFKGTDIKKAIVHIEDGLDLVVGDLALSEADSEFTQTGREYMLSEALETVKSNYDFCVIDTEPHLGIMLTNGLTASNGAIIPLTADRFNIKGVKQLGKYIFNIRKYCNSDLQIYGMLLTKYDKRKLINRVLIDEIEEAAALLETKVFSSTIRESVKVRETQAMQEDIFQSESAVANDYQAFIKELLEEME